MDNRYKFRAWDPLNKEMHYMKMALYQGDEQKAFVLPQEEQSLANAYSSMNLDAVVIMQCSGSLATKHTEERNRTTSFYTTATLCTSLIGSVIAWSIGILGHGS